MNKNITCVILLCTLVAPIALANQYSLNKKCPHVQISRLAYSPQDWAVLDKDALQRAFKVPAQWSIPEFRMWSCGPNSGARALNMLNTDQQQFNTTTYAEFVRNCPKSLGKPGTQMGAKLCASVVVAGIGGILVPGRFEQLVSSFVVAVGFAPYLMGLISDWTSLNLNVGPAPDWLTQYIQEKSDCGLKADTVLTSDFSEVISEIKKSLTAGRPVIAKTVYGVSAWHYFTVVGFNEKLGVVQYLDTDGGIYYLTLEELKCWMTLDAMPEQNMVYNAAIFMLSGLASKITPFGTFNLIVFR